MKTSELSGAALDWAVWTAAGGAAAYPHTASGKSFLKLWKGNTSKYVHPSTDWSQGGPIIERELISVWLAMDDIFKKDTWAASYSFMDGDRVCEPEQEYWGPTPLIAAMRCYVASKLGEEVEIPEELKGE